MFLGRFETPFFDSTVQYRRLFFLFVVRLMDEAGSICPLGMLAHSAPGDAISLEAEHRCVARLIAKLLTSRRLKLQNTKDLPDFLARGRLFEVFFGFISKHSIT